MKTLTTLVFGALLLGTSAFASDLDGQLVSKVVFNAQANSYHVEFTNDQPQDFDSANLVIKLDSTAQAPYLKKGMHLYYVVFPSFKAMNQMATDLN